MLLEIEKIVRHKHGIETELTTHLRLFINKPFVIHSIALLDSPASGRCFGSDLFRHALHQHNNRGTLFLEPPRFNIVYLALGDTYGIGYVSPCAVPLFQSV